MSVDDSERNEGRPQIPADVRRVSDTRTLRALTHPVRIALIEALSISGGALTATEVGEQIGETPTTCSFHLRQLAKYGFVEEAGGGRGRARPWRMTSIGMSLTANQGDPEAELAASALLRLVRERQLERYRTWLETRATYPPQWRAASSDSEYIFYLTPDELEALNEEVGALLTSRVRERLTDASKRPPGSVPVELLMFSYPLALPSEPAGEAGTDGGGPSGDRSS
jgi:DNA-binding MarR family transcriptional regulator